MDLDFFFDKMDLDFQFEGFLPYKVKRWHLFNLRVINGKNDQIPMYIVFFTWILLNSTLFISEYILRFSIKICRYFLYMSS